MGLMTAVLRADGIWPACREWLITCVIRGFMAHMLALIRAVGKGFKAQVEDFILLMMSSTSHYVTFKTGFVVLEMLEVQEHDV